MLYEILNKQVQVINETLGKPEFLLSKEESERPIGKDGGAKEIFCRLTFRRTGATEAMVIQENHAWDGKTEITDYNKQKDLLLDKCCRIFMVLIFNNGLERFVHQNKNPKL